MSRLVHRQELLWQEARGRRWCCGASLRWRLGCCEVARWLATVWRCNSIVLTRYTGEWLADAMTYPSTYKWWQDASAEWWMFSSLCVTVTVTAVALFAKGRCNMKAAYAPARKANPQTLALAYWRSVRTNRFMAWMKRYLDSLRLGTHPPLENRVILEGKGLRLHNNDRAACALLTSTKV